MFGYYEEKECGGTKGWWWIRSDSGAWDGPKHDWENHHLPNIKKYLPADRGVVIQAGGNQGMYPVLLSELFDSVYTFEPDHLNFDVLSRNCESIENIFKFQAGLGDSNGFGTVSRISMQNVGMHTIETDVMGQVPIVALDLFFPFARKIDLIMLDVEQYELYALAGAINLIKRNKPIIFVERPNEAVYNLMKRLEYKAAANSAMDVIFVAS